MRMASLETTTKNDQPDPRLMGQVEPGLWVGALQAVKEIRKVHNHWTVVSVLQSDKLAHFLESSLQEIRQVYPDVQIHHENWDIADKSQSDFLSERLEEILVQIDQRLESQPPGNGHVLVHCALGISRSVSICAAWLISRRHLSLAEALERIRLVRPNASPNMGFVAALRALEQCQGNVAAARERMNARQTVSSQGNSIT